MAGNDLMGINLRNSFWQYDWYPLAGISIRGVVVWSQAFSLQSKQPPSMA